MKNWDPIESLGSGVDVDGRSHRNGQYGPACLPVVAGKEGSEMKKATEQPTGDDVKATERLRNGHPLARDLLLRCSDVIEGLFDDVCPWPEMSELMDEICKYLKEGE